MRVLLGCLLTSTLLACQAQVAPPAGGRDSEAQLLARIKGEVGAAPCSSDAQCRTLGIGAKACGGPVAWWPWSEVNARADRLQAWAQELTRLQRQANERSGLMSNCQYVGDPGAACVAQRCVLNDRSALK